MTQEKQFLEALRPSDGSLRVELDPIQAAFSSVFPHLDASSERRSKLREMLDALAHSGDIRLPVDRRRGWQNFPSPSLPMMITLSNRKKKSQAQLEYRNFPWVSEMAFVAKLPSLRVYQEALKLHAFLKNGGTSSPVIPTKERSWQIFGDEKRLETLLQSELFGVEKLTLELLRCRVVTQVLAFARPSKRVNAPILIVENECTFHSFCRLNHQVKAYAGVVLGDGNRVLKAVGFLHEISSVLGAKTFLYFGDLDERGLAIGGSLSGLMAAHDICVVPADTLYQALLEVRRPDQPCPVYVAESALNWLPIALRAAVHQHLTTFGRIAQEGLGWETLSAMFGANPHIEFALGFTGLTYD